MQTTLTKPWAIFCTSDGQSKCVARFFNRQDAEDYLKFLCRRVPQHQFDVAYDKQELINNG
ncbi:hypothetical protein I8748_22900 [Nostoc sp. CENA67]|uniref:Uncharacterized protein n=1 Tax=Amazonocrinis nigriterrae CENA67 TaxID=2794033 RepID=A0A8J7LCS2_9NOST|nr:hypothetical protein [Amazonocrinis nigriterrae]MBH8564996.1 hypothetical protein [Amazonocrinis nigriterrae CENA67]